MSLHFHPIKIKDIRRETSDCVSIGFDIPENLQETFRFQQGQSLTLRTHINGEEIRRTYSICTSPFEKEWRVAVKKVEGGIFSSHANDQLKVGDIIDLMPPVGKFNTPLNPSQKKRYMAIAAGSGITPVLSLAKTILATEPLSEFTLVYGNRSRSSIIFFEELEGLKNKYMNRFTLIHVLSREKTDTAINAGRIEPKKLEDLSKLIDFKSLNEFFLCGPEQMIFSSKEYLESIGINKHQIHFELFNTGTAAITSRQKKKTDGEQNKLLSTISIKLDGRNIDFTVPMNSELSILDAALEQGADLPFACKGGVCCTCKAKLIEGSVHMDVHWGLEEDEIEKGFILTCQSHPKTERVRVDFDDR